MDQGWYYSPDHGQLCQVIETQTLWGETTCRVWLPGSDAVVRIPASRLKPLADAGAASPDAIAYIAAAARVADALTQDVLLAPIESSVIPLPHQIRALSRAIANDRVRYLLADEVGLGKTIEAGLIMRELKLRGLVKRTLVIAPKGLVTQWVSEMRLHFGEAFQLVLPEDIKSLQRITPAAAPGHEERSGHDPENLPANPWRMFSQIVVPMDSVKPLDKRRGWSAAQVREHNRFVFEGSVEHRVREVLEEKLAIIFEEFGIDKTGDVLDSAQAGRLFDDMYVEAILNPDKIEDSVEGVIARLQEQARVARSTASALGATQDLEPGEAQRLLTHPLPHWVERMTVSYLKSRGGQVERRNQGWDLTWPDGQTFKNVVFAGKEAERLPAARHLTLEEPRVRGLAMRIPRCAPGQPAPVVAIPGVTASGGRP